MEVAASMDLTVRPAGPPHSGAATPRCLWTGPPWACGCPHPGPVRQASATARPRARRPPPAAASGLHPELERPAEGDVRVERHRAPLDQPQPGEPHGQALE